MFFSFCAVGHVLSILLWGGESLGIVSLWSIDNRWLVWGGESLGIVSLWSTNNRWPGLRHPPRHVARFVAPSTIAKEKLPRCASACVYLKRIPGLINFDKWSNVYCYIITRINRISPILIRYTQLWRKCELRNRNYLLSQVPLEKQTLTVL